MPKLDNFSLSKYSIGGFSAPDPIIIKPAVYSGDSVVLSFTSSSGSVYNIQYFTCDYSDLGLSVPPRMVHIVRNLNGTIAGRNFIASYLEGMKYGGVQVFATNYIGYTSVKLSPNAYVTATSCRLAGSSDSTSWAAFPEAYAYIIP